MPQAPNNGIPPAHGGCASPGREVRSRKGGDGPDRGGLSSGAEASWPPRPGVFPFSWGWQLAGLIGAILTGLLFLAVSGFATEGRLLLVLPGLGLLGLSIYAAARTNWLREAATKPLPVKIAAGVAVICGLVPIAGFLLGGAIFVGIGAVLLGALGEK